jgi:hypothetical protein
VNDLKEDIKLLLHQPTDDELKLAKNILLGNPTAYKVETDAGLTLNNCTGAMVSHCIFHGFSVGVKSQL